jgi:hypothetical protein
MGGEKVKKAVLVIAVALMAVAMLATPVLAASPNKTLVTASNLATLGSEYDPLTFRWITDGNISHIVYMKLWGTLQINVDGEVIPVNWVDILSGTYNMKTLKGVWKWDEVWTLPNGDTFEGTAHVKFAGGNLITFTEFYAHIILHGTGAYDGQILSLEMDRPSRSVPGVYEGYWLKP